MPAPRHSAPLQSLASLAAIATLCLAGCSHIGPFHAYTISSESMHPTVSSGDTVIVNQVYYRTHGLADGDIVALRHNGYTIIKRITALPGETIEGRDNIIYRNGHALDEPYTQHVGDAPTEATNFALRTIPAGEVFLTGDNRDRSLDSRITEFGTVHTADIVGILTHVEHTPKAAPPPN